MKTIIIYSGAACAPCKALKYEMASLEAELAGVTVEERDIKQHMTEVKALGLRTTPTVVYEGRILFTGNLGREAIVNCLKANGVI